MNWILAVALLLPWLAIIPGGWIAWQLLRQNGRVLLRLDALEFEAEQASQRRDRNGTHSVTESADGREGGFARRPLSRSKIKRDGLSAGSLAPEFCLPRLDGKGDLSLGELRGHRVLLVFSSPNCEPCQTLAPQLEKFHRTNSEIDVVVISKGDRKENQKKVEEHRLTYPVVLQQHWEISRHYAMFATPIAYLIDETGKIINGVAIGVDSILKMMTKAAVAVRDANVSHGRIPELDGYSGVKFSRSS